MNDNLVQYSSHAIDGSNFPNANVKPDLFILSLGKFIVRVLQIEWVCDDMDAELIQLNHASSTGPGLCTDSRRRRLPCSDMTRENQGVFCFLQWWRKANKIQMYVSCINTKLRRDASEHCGAIFLLSIHSLFVLLLSCSISSHLNKIDGNGRHTLLKRSNIL